MSSFEYLPFYRGVSARHPTAHASVQTTRKNRQPRNTPEQFHVAANHWFFQKFGIYYRSEAVFVSSSPFIASHYGHTQMHQLRIIPLEHYRFCWSRNFSDMFNICNGIVRVEELIERLESADYTETDLQAAHQCGHEVMLYCNSYIEIPKHLLDSNKHPASDNITSQIIIK